MPSVIIGLLAIAFGLWGLTVWWWSVAEVLRGVVPIAGILIGILALSAGVSKVRAEKDVKDVDLTTD